ncbi:hypothetical protein GCM10011352_03830 [Marinobacterium zhoushanense]|uniref:Photosynthesis system II assembly factor Ycf48/Hcf136-like domain-containing protein n=2 Tax=Marinobacterium zhoushanense TaxID=1679163 RepID=A0ABQ1K1Z7_9GAMM|nr:hypothetical protein GCM10011352_03830 [Marinobacterium zhoushanense]
MPRLILQDIDLVGGRLIGVGEYGAIVWSDDRGAHWQQADVPVSVGLNAIAMQDAVNGWAVGHAGVVLSTEDGGASWHQVLDGVSAAQLLLIEAEQLADKGELDDLRLTMARLSLQDGADKPFFDIAITEGKRLIAVGAFNLAFATDDAGTTWKPLSYALPNPMESHLYAVDARGATVFIAGEFGLVMRSVDGGHSFQALETPYQGSFFDIAYNGRDLVVAGLRGNVFLSRDAGDSWQQVEGGGTASVSAVESLADGAFLLTDQAGQLWRLEPGAEVDLHYSRLEIEALPPASDAVLVDNEQLFVTGMGGTVGPLTMPTMVAGSGKP